MKAIKFMVFLLMAGTTCGMLTSCEEDTVGMENYYVVNFEGEYFAKLIDSPQYGGPLLYGGSTAWTDVQTSLSGETTVTDWGNGTISWTNGIAISNYVDSNVKDNADYLHHLSVPTSNGSKQFGVVWEEATVAFADGKARQIQSADICPTTYLLGTMQNGGPFSKALTEKGDYFTLTLTADNGAEMDIDLARDGQIQSGWKSVDLSRLGKVKTLSFSFSGSDASQWGLNTPKYVAVDNFVVNR